jgi:glycosyltransferase involved in cell wall biosynthesis
MRILFIYFQNVLEAWENSVNGTLKRQQMHLEAIKEIAHIDILSYVPVNTDISLKAVNEGEKRLSQKLGTKDIRLFFCYRNENPEQWPFWKRYGYGIFSFFNQHPYWGVSGQNQVQAFEECLELNPDIIFVQRLTAIAPLLLTKKPLPPIIFDLDDIEHIRFSRQLKNSQNPVSLLRFLHLPARFLGEWNTVRLAERIFVCSEIDKQYLRKLTRTQGVITISNSVFIPAIQPITDEPSILFLGTYSSFSNVEAANFLIEKVWPIIYQQMPNAKLILAGNKPENIRSYRKNILGIHYTGFVEDLESLYAQTRIVCCPIFTGAGTRVKLVEAAAYGKPIVANRLGAEGLNLIPKQDYLEGNNAKSIANICLELLRNKQLCNQLGSSARARAIKYYNRTDIIKMIQNQIHQVMENS